MDLGRRPQSRREHRSQRDGTNTGSSDQAPWRLGPDAAREGVLNGPPDREEKHGGASEPTGPTGPRDAAEPEPTGPTGPRDAAELTEGAQIAAQGLADMLEDRPKPPERREARDGYLYSKEAFLAHYGDVGEDRWEEAEQPGEYIYIYGSPPTSTPSSGVLSGLARRRGC